MPVTPTADATFRDDVLASEEPVLVDFTGEWCPPCQMLGPTLARLADEQAGRLRVVTLDVDANPETTLRYGVRGLPTLGLFVGGELVTTVVGGRPGWAILQAIEPFLPVAAP